MLRIAHVSEGNGMDPRDRYYKVEGETLEEMVHKIALHEGIKTVHKVESAHVKYGLDKRVQGDIFFVDDDTLNVVLLDPNELFLIERSNPI